MIKFENYQPVLGDRTFLSPLSCNLQPGEFCVFTAPSGAGKTRLLETMVNESLASKGNMTCDDPIVSVPQSLDLCEQLSAWENVACAQLKKYPWWKTLFGFPSEEKLAATKALETFKFDEPEKTVSVLSGGERQRVALARLIHSDRNFWILDEPVSNLDEVSALACLKTLKDLAKERNATVLCVLHHQHLADSVADRTFAWNEGWVVS